jgi:hypothetical protein
MRGTIGGGSRIARAATRQQKPQPRDDRAGGFTVRPRIRKREAAKVRIAWDGVGVRAADSRTTGCGRPQVFGLKMVEA